MFFLDLIQQVRTATAAKVNMKSPIVEVYISIFSPEGKLVKDITRISTICTFKVACFIAIRDRRTFLGNNTGTGHHRCINDASTTSNTGATDSRGPHISCSRFCDVVFADDTDFIYVA